MRADEDPATEHKTLHLAGIGVKHSIGLPMHNVIAESLGLPWTFYNTECPTIEKLVTLARAESTAGLVVTMPYKNIVMKHVDQLDELATMIGACNNIYRNPEDPRVLVGTNTDWLGVKESLLEKADESARQQIGGPHLPALVVGAGGASRAAVYSLAVHLHTSVIYVLNRDEKEVLDLMQDSRRFPLPPTLIHIKTLEQARAVKDPYYVVGTVPDIEPKTVTENAVATILKGFLSRPTKGVLLDMCYAPRRTRMIRLAESLGWPTVEGTHAVGHQMDQQWRLWTGKEIDENLYRGAAWDTLKEAAEESKDVNF